MNKLALIAAAALPLLACNKSPEVSATNASANEVAAKVREATGGNGFILPGEWQSTVTIDKFDMPGMPPEALADMKKAMAQNQHDGFKSCVTAEEVKHPDGKFFTGNDQCRYDHFTMGGGKIDAAMKCDGGQGMKQVMMMNGTYSPESYDMHMSSNAEGAPGAAGAMKMEMHVQSRRIGECTEKS